LAINPPSDIVLGVANAADPQKLRAAAAQLARADGNALTDGAGPTGAAAGALKLVSKSPPVFDPQANASAQMAAKPAQGAAAKRAPDAYTKFEAFLVQTFVESMLPSDAPNVYGGGVAGKIWKSMLAEHLANAMVKGTAFGIADSIAKHRAMIDKANATGVSAVSHPSAALGETKAGAVAELHSLITAPAQPQAAALIQRDRG